MSIIPKNMYSYDKCLELSLKKDGYALYQLGLFYLNNNEDKSNNEKIFDSFAKSAKQNCKEGINALANCLYFGSVCEKDINKALEYYEKSRQLGYLKATYNLGIHYHNQESYDNKLKGYEYLLEAFNAGSHYPLYRLGKVFEKGILNHIDIDFDKALIYFESAAQHNDQLAIKLLGNYYYFGIHPIKKDKPKSMEYYNQLEKVSKAIERRVKDFNCQKY